MRRKYGVVGRTILPVRDLLILPVGVSLYAFVLHWVYANLVTGRFAYLGYRYEAPTAALVIFVVVAACLTAAFLPRKLTHPSSFVLWVLFVVTVAPGILMTPYTSLLDDTMALIVSLTLSATFIGVSLGVRPGRPLKSLKTQVSPTTFWIVIGVISAATYGLMAFTVGLSLQFVDILDVYDVREEYSAGLGGAGMLGYLVSTQANVINPIIIARGLYSRRWHFVALGALGQAVLFSGTGFKTILFSIPALVIVALIFRFNLRPRGQLFLWGAASVVVASAVLDHIQNTIIWTSLFSRRFLLTPGLFMSAYVAFFDDNPKANLAYSVLAPWIDYPYELTPPRQIGSWLANSPTTAMNANLFADGFANFGWWGFVGAGVLLLVFLRVLDRVSAGVPVAVTALIMTMPTIALSNASILTSMFSHGLVAAVLLLAIAPRTGWGRKVTARGLADDRPYLRGIARRQLG